MSAAPKFYALQIGGPTSKVRMHAFAAGVEALGGEVLRLTSRPHEEIDEALDRLTEGRIPSFGFACGMHDYDADARWWLAERGLPLLVLDCGYFARSKNAGDRIGYNQLGLSGLCWIPPIDVPSDRFDAFRLKIADARKPVARPVALVLGQVPGDTQHHLSAEQLTAWMHVRAGLYREKGYSIVYRPHPKNPSVPFELPHRRIDPATHDVSHDLSAPDVAVVVTYNSTAGLEALMAGIPVDCAPCAHYAHVADLRSADAFSRHLHRLAYAQWTCAELESGEPLRFMNQFARLLPEEATE